MVWACTADVCMIHDVVKHSLRNFVVKSWTVVCLREWTPLLPYQTYPSFPLSSSNRPLFRFFLAAHSNISVSFAYTIAYGPVLTLLRIQNASTHAFSTGRHCVVAASEGGYHLYPGLAFNSLRLCVYNLNRAEMLCFYLMNLGICPGLNYLDCLSGGSKCPGCCN